MPLVNIMMLLGAGYVSGLTIASGFLAAALKEDWARRQLRTFVRFWNVVAVLNLVLAVSGFVFLFSAALYSKNTSDAQFFLEAGLFVIGLLSAATLVFYSFHRIGKMVTAAPQGTSSDGS